MKPEIEALAVQLADLRASQRAMHEIFLAVFEEALPRESELKATIHSKHAEFYEYYRRAYMNGITDHLREVSKNRPLNYHQLSLLLKRALRWLGFSR